VRIEGTDYDIIIGPLFVTPITEEIVDEFLSDYQTPQENRADASDTLYSLPLISHYLYHSCLVMGDTLREKRIGALVKGQKYAVRVDAFNENGIAHGRTRFL